MEIPLWFSNLVFWSAQIAVLVLAAGLLPRALKIRRPGVLFGYWRLLLTTTLLLPLIEPWHRPPNGRPFAFSADFVGVPLPAPALPAASRSDLPGLETIAPLLGMVILVGIGLRFAVLALGLLKLRRIRQASRPIPRADDSAAVLRATRALVEAPAEFRLSAQVDSPVTFGFRAPVVLLPERFAYLEPRHQSAIACHELLHVRRQDWAHHLGEEVLRSLLWFHPAMVWLVSRVRLAREQIVDLEVLRLTVARKPYLEALLEFSNPRSPITAIPAPPFLAERQLVERVTLMLQEVHMSRKRLIVSLTLISCCLALIAVLAAWAFPLKGAPRPAPAALSRVTQQNLDQAAPLLRRIGVKHHDFAGEILSDQLLSDEQTRLNQLPGRLRVETAYDRAEADKMEKALEDFWSERGITVEVRTTLTPGLPSARYANLEFDVYQQTVLPGRLAGGIAGGVSQGISRGVAEGVSGGIARSISGRGSTHPSPDEPSVDISSIWTDTVKRGAMPLQARGTGTLVRLDGSANLVARVTLPASLAADVKPGQNAQVDLKNGALGGGRVRSVGPDSNDTRTIDIALEQVPQGATAGLEVVATIDIGKLDNVLYVGRPVIGRANSETILFRIINHGSEAVRTSVKLGRASVTTIEVLDGLKEGDTVILSDVSYVESAARIRLTDEHHLRKH